MDVIDKWGKELIQKTILEMTGETGRTLVVFSPGWTTRAFSSTGRTNYIYYIIFTTASTLKFQFSETLCLILTFTEWLCTNNCFFFLKDMLPKLCNLRWWSKYMYMFVLRLHSFSGQFGEKGQNLKILFLPNFSLFFYILHTKEKLNFFNVFNFNFIPFYLNIQFHTNLRDSNFSASIVFSRCEIYYII